MAFGITESGFNTKSFSDVQDNLFARARQDFGADVDLSAASPIRQFIDSFAITISDIGLQNEDIDALWPVLSNVFWSAYPSTATGTALDYVVGFRGLTRQAAQKASGVVTFTGSSGTSIPEGTIISTANNTEFITTRADSIPNTGAIDIPVEAVETGPDGNVAPQAIQTIVDSLDVEVSNKNQTENQHIGVTQTGWRLVDNDEERDNYQTVDVVSISHPINLNEFQITVRNPFQEPQSAPSVAVNNSSGNLNGTYKYVTTFVMEDFGETTKGSESGAVSPTDEQVDLTSIPTGPDITTSRKLYRAKDEGGGSFSDFEFIAEISDNITTSYTDNVDDSQVGDTPPVSSEQTFSLALSVIDDSTPTDTVGQTELVDKTLAGGEEADLVFQGEAIDASQVNTIRIAVVNSDVSDGAIQVAVDNQEPFSGGTYVSEGVSKNEDLILRVTSVTRGQFEGGQNRETDVALRKRYFKALHMGGNARIAAIVSELQKVTGIRSVHVDENDSWIDKRDSGGLPPHSFEAVVFGGFVEDIGEKLIDSASAGIYAVGDRTVTLQDDHGQFQTVRFSRPTQVSIFVDIADLERDPSLFPSDGEEQIKDAVVETIGGVDSNSVLHTGFGVGEDVSHIQIARAVAGVDGVEYAEVQLGKSSDPATENRIPIGRKEIAQTNLDNIRFV